MTNENDKKLFKRMFKCFSLAFTDFTQFIFFLKWSQNSSGGLVKNTQSMPFLDVLI